MRPGLVGSKLCLERKDGSAVDNTPVQLNECVYVATPSGASPIAAQEWSWPTG